MTFTRHIRRALCVCALLLPSVAHADLAAQVAQSCLDPDDKTLAVVPLKEVSQQDGTPVFASLDALTKMGRDIAQSGTAATWSLNETFVAAYGQDADALLTGALGSTVLRSELGLMVRWENAYLGTVCLLPVPAQAGLDAAQPVPVIGETSVLWRAAATGQAADYVSQILILSDRPQ